jgi:HD-GYP domain-containing protein (c-di-GMP phosphodiesterase class II)
VFRHSPTAPRRVIFLSGVVPVLVAALLSIYRPPFFDRLDRATYDIVLRMAGTKPPGPAVVIVDVDERSLSAIGQWPWRRDLVGRLIAALHDAGAAVIAIDVIFAESDRHESPASRAGSSPDEQLAAALRGRPVILGYGLTFGPGAPSARSCGLRPLGLAVIQPPGSPAAALAEGADVSPEPYFRATGAVCNLPGLAHEAAGFGFLNAVPDADGILRRVPLIAELDGRVYPSLALSAVTAAIGGGHPALQVANVNASTLRIGDLTVPLDGKSNLLVAYRGKKRSFPYVSAADVMAGTGVGDTLRGKIVLIGTTALGTREVVATPLDTQFVGVEVQATVVDNLMQRDFIRRPAAGTLVDAAIVVAAGVLTAAMVAGTGVTAGLLSGGALIAGVWWGAAWLLSAGRLFISPLSPTMAVVLTLAVLILARFTAERRRAIGAGLETIAARRLMVQALLSLTEARDAETGRHSRRTQQYTRLLAGPLSTHPAFRDYLTRERIDLLASLAPLHDIGKVGVSDRVLNKPGPLTSEETVEMRSHPELGRDVILRAEARVGVRDDVTLQIAKDIVYTHHERWDGTGYPQGLRGTDIPIAGRIMAVVDVYDAVRARSLYSACRSHEETVEVIVAGKHSHFDPDVVDAFLLVSASFASVSDEALGDPSAS